MEQDLAKALEILRNGGVILYPTDTVWGIGCDATDPEAVSRIFNIKRRDDAKAMLSLVDSPKSLSRWVKKIPEKARQYLSDPASPVTIIYDSPKDIADNLRAEDGSAAFRVTSHGFSRLLCRDLGKPLVSTSANVSGENAPTTFSEISEEIKGLVDYICLTDRDREPSSPSRIIKISDSEEVTILR